MVSVIDEVGMTACVLILKGRMVYRSLYVHGRILTGVADTPCFLTEVSAVHAIRVLHDWIRENPAAMYDVTGGQRMRGNISCAETLRRGSARAL